MKKILIIDDDKVFVKTLTDFLPKEKYETLHANDGIEGLKLVEKENLDLIILDLLMPKMGGMEFLDELRNKKLSKQTPILISSQLSKIEDISKAIVAGMDIGVKGYVIKASENLDMIVGEIEKTLAKYSV
jgi:CheY-like chemotaxis protein